MKKAANKAANLVQQRKPSRPPKRRFTTQLWVWEGVTIRIKYEPSWLNVPETETANIELHVLNPEGALLPVTETGYRSHFLRRGDVEAAGGLIPYVQQWLAGAPSWRRALDLSRQLSLF